MFDKDILKPNDSLGDFEIYLNEPKYKLFSKAYKKKERVEIKVTDPNSKRGPINRFWVPFKKLGEVQGFGEISIEVVPKWLAEKENNGMGRDAPNQFPTLPDPVGRF